MIEYIMTYFLRFVFHQISIPPIMPIIKSPTIYSILSLMFQIFQFVQNVGLAYRTTENGLAMWRILAQKFNRIITVEPCTNVS